MDVNLDGLLDGLGKIREISFRDGTLILKLSLEGLPGGPISIAAENISISPDGGEIVVGGFKSDMPFVQTALNRFLSAPIKIPETARPMLRTIKNALDL